MASADVKRYTVSMKLAKGYNSNGDVLVMSVSLGSLNTSTYNYNDAMSYAAVLSRAYSQMLVRVEETRLQELYND